jgi:deazaflavin-dependent oxidoreductase (nitroreductase family)
MGALKKRFSWLLKNTLNRLTTRVARSGHGPFSLIRHVGRTSGRTYETPVILVRVPEGFIAELTFGDKVDWYRNVVAAHGCTVVHHRADHRVTRIERCDARDGRAVYPTPFRQLLTVLHREEYRLLRTET